MAVHTSLLLSPPLPLLFLSRCVASIDEIVKRIIDYAEPNDMIAAHGLCGDIYKKKEVHLKKNGVQGGGGTMLFVSLS